MKRLLAIAVLVEVATGVAMFAAPSLVGRLLLGAELAGVAATVGRAFAIAIISLGVACWPGKVPTNAAVAGMVTYGALITLYLAFVGVRGEWVGPMLWPAIVMHAILTVLLIIAHIGQNRRTETPNTGVPPT